MELVFKEESYAIVGACFEVYKELGCGFLESVYEECLGIEFELQGIQFSQQPLLTLSYKQRQLTKTFQPDFICLDNIVVEIKAATAISESHRAQVHNYLKATAHRLGLLANFGSYPQLEWERIVR
jgi:GxxExxY protein